MPSNAIKSCGTGFLREQVVFNRKSGVISGVIWDNIGIDTVLSSFQHGRTIKCEKQRYFIMSRAC
jgi:hypothetical protein